MKMINIPFKLICVVAVRIIYLICGKVATLVAQEHRYSFHSTSITITNDQTLSAVRLLTPNATSISNYQYPDHFRERF